MLALIILFSLILVILLFTSGPVLEKFRNTLFYPLPKSYVISIRPERYQDFRDRMKEWERKVELVPGVVGATQDLRALERNGIISVESDLGAGQIGCWLSHLGIWKRIAQGPEGSSGVIFEDDADIHYNLETQQRLELAMGDLKNISYDIAFLGHNRRNAEANTEDRVSEHWSRAKKNCGAFAYIISQRGAKILSTLAKPIPDRPVDNWIIDQMRAGKVNVLCLNPRLCFVVPVLSDTEVKSD